MSIEPAKSIGAEAWDRVVRHAPWGQFWHRWDWCQYSLAFAGPDAVDDSFAVVRSGSVLGQPDAVCPLIWEPATNSYTMGGEPGPCPASWSGQALVEALDYAWTRAQERGVGLTFRLPPDRGAGFETPTGWTAAGWMTRCVSLRPAWPILWRDVRKSYHGLIHRAEASHRMVISSGDALAMDYERLHKATVGTLAPRPDETYRLQAQWLKDRDAVLIGAMDRGTNRWDGFVYVFLHQGHAYYGSGPSRPGATVMHGLQWAAIRHCQAIGAHTYEMGWQGHATDVKGKGIEMFKRGFGGRDLALVNWTRG